MLNDALGDANFRANVAFVRRGADAKRVVRDLEPASTVEDVKAVKGRSSGHQAGCNSTAA
jgi:hypothetical protein